MRPFPFGTRTQVPIIFVGIEKGAVVIVRAGGFTLWKEFLGYCALL